MHRLRVIAVFFPVVACLASCDSAKDDEVDVVRYSGSEINWEKVPDWTASLNDGVVTLDLSYTGSPEEKGMLEGKDVRGIDVGEMLTLIMIDHGTQLPTFVSAERTLAPGYKGTYKALRLGPMRSGMIQIESWDINGVLRGRIRGNVGFVTEIDTYFTAGLSSAERKEL